MAQGGWAPTEAEAALLSTCEAIVYMHDGLHEVVRLDALPKELASLVRQQEREEARKAVREIARRNTQRLSALLRRQANTFRVGAQAKGPR